MDNFIKKTSITKLAQEIKSSGEEMSMVGKATTTKFEETKSGVFLPFTDTSRVEKREFRPHGKGHLAKPGDSFACHNWGGSATGI